MRKVLPGIDNLALADGVLKGRRVGLMTNQTGMDSQFHSTIDLLNARYHLTALFAVEHGIRGNVQAGEHLEEGETDPRSGVAVHSVYGKTRRLTPEMLDTFDVFCFDIQDVGLRFYTYLYALSFAMEACAEAGKPVVVFDRVNPLGGTRVEGTLLDEALASYVGMYAMPTRYGMTIGEYARWVKDHLRLDGLSLTVVPLVGWRREPLDRIELPWVAPSPNCPTFHAAMAYCGTCLFEGTNVSEGRGTCMPFEYIGAPWIDAGALAEHMKARNLPGLFFRENYFTPSFSKHAGKLCAGVQMHILDAEKASPILGALSLLDEIRAMYPDELTFVRLAEEGPYTIDKLLGTDAYRTGALDGPALLEAHRPAVERFAGERRKYLLYEEAEA